MRGKKIWNKSIFIVLFFILCYIWYAFISYTNTANSLYEMEINRTLRADCEISVDDVKNSIESVSRELVSMSYGYKSNGIYDIERLKNTINEYSDKNNLGKLKYYDKSELKNLFDDVFYYEVKLLNGESVAYINKNKKDHKSKIGIAVPLFQNNLLDKQNEMIGVIACEYSEDELHNIFINNTNSFGDIHLIGSDGYVFCGESDFENNNCFNFLEKVDILSDENLFDIKKMVEKGDDINIHYRKDGIEYYAYISSTQISKCNVFFVTEKGDISGQTKSISDLAYALASKIIFSFILLAGVFSYVVTKHNKKLEESKEEMETIMNNIPGGVLKIKIANNEINYASDGFYELLGYNRESYEALYGKDSEAPVHPDDIEMVKNQTKIQLEEKGFIKIEYRVIKRDNSVAWFIAQGEPIKDNGQDCLQMVIIDNTANHEANKEIKLAKENLEIITNSIAGGVLSIIYPKGSEKPYIGYANEGFYKMVGYSKKEVEKMNYLDFVYPDDRSKIQFNDKNKNKYELELRILNKNGNIYWTHTNVSSSKDVYGNDEYLCVIVDISDIKNASREVEFEKEKYKIISELTDDILFEYDIEKDEFVVSDNFKKTYGYTPYKNNFIKKLRHNNLIYKEDKKFFWEIIDRIGKDIFTFDFEIRIKSKSGNYLWASFQGTSMFDETGKPVKIVGKVTNIDRMKKEIEDLKEKSLKDGLTKVYNKVSTSKVIDEYFEGDGKNKKHALLMIDIDNFKSVNDNLGHTFGDAVLMEVASNIKKVFNKGEIIGRIGGDEFVTLLNDITDENEIKRKAEKMCQIFRNTYSGENNDYKISASIGISRYPEDGLNYDELFKKADVAVYIAKDGGKDQYKIFENEMLKRNIVKKGRPIIDKYLTPSDRSMIYENLVSNIIEMLLETKDINVSINMIMAMVGKKYDLSRVYIHESNENDTYFNNTYEWLADGIESVYDKNTVIPMNIIENMVNEFGLENGASFNNIEDVKDREPDAYKIFKKNKTKATIQWAQIYNGRIRVVIGYCDNNKEREWKQEEFKMFITISKLVGSFLLRRQTENKLLMENRINQAIVNNQQVETYIIDTKTFEILYVNSNVCEKSENAKVGALCYEALKDRAKPCENCPILSLLPNSETNTVQSYDKESNQWRGITATRMPWSGGKEAALICNSNITEFIERMNSRDTLTGLASINKFKLQVELKLEDKQRNNEYALIYCDIEKFKFINDSFGYSIGDELLRSFAMLMYSLLDEDELFCRATDDKFIILIKYFDLEKLKVRLQNIIDNVSEMQQRFFKDINLILIMGVYIIGKDETDLNNIMDRANIARKKAKGAHQSTYAIYTDEIHLSIEKEKQIEAKMISALNEKEFVVYYQPKIDLVNDKIIGAESLVRWQQKDGKIVPPNDFIPIFEKNGFIINLDFYVYEETFKQMRKWLDEGKPLLCFSVNISRTHISNPSFVNDLVSLVLKYRIPFEKIELELTESIFIESGDVVVDVLNKLKAYGFKLSIDDFGSAYSSLNLLKNLPVDIIKLDKEFFHYEYGDGREKTIIRHIIRMAKDLDLKVICEGVETKEQAEFLMENHCDYAQGYYYSRPLEVKLFEEFWEEWS